MKVNHELPRLAIGQMIQETPLSRMCTQVLVSSDQSSVRIHPVLCPNVEEIVGAAGKVKLELLG
jgi:hypothetical protein